MRAFEIINLEAERDAARSLAMTLEEQLAVAEGLAKKLFESAATWADQSDVVSGRVLRWLDPTPAEAALLAKLGEEPSE